MNRLAVIGCSGFAAMLGLEVLDHQRPDTPYGPASAPVIRCFLGSAEFFFLPRHGMGHGILPHRINYRANLWALNACGAEQVVGLAAVGGIADAFGPRVLAVPDQIIDYTYGRAHSFSDGGQGEVLHIDFTRPYCEELRQALLRTTRNCDLDVEDGSTYGMTQGPRLEMAAEIMRLERDGCDLVGVTGMPEAALAKELGLCYACMWSTGRPVRRTGKYAWKRSKVNITARSVHIERILTALGSANSPNLTLL